MASTYASSILNWWVESGVDTLVGERPRNWLEREAAPAAPAEAPALPLDAMPPPTPTATPLPDTLPALRDWLLTPGNLPGGFEGTPMVGASGDPGAGLMILIDMPSLEDIGAGLLLSGETGILFDRMMGAIGRSREQLYLAALSPFRPASGAFDPATARRLAALARHHVSLVRPRHLIVFGDGAARPLFDAPVPRLRGRWLSLEAGDQAIRTLVTIRPEKLLAQPALKRLAWEDLQMLKEELA